ncbi:MAG: ATP-binding cassette domain-containing protein [Planctomycetes bacterium]|jgi:lipooligosaccharide transport system ATP-binding protein|nr:ATP-binding cassette domain-containing protein [Planctomycetota bacterium]
MSNPFHHPPLLDATGLEKSLGGKRVVHGIDLRCHAGEVLGLLGPNGAGKTTTLRMCYGYLRCDAGRVLIDGHDLDTQSDLARRVLGVCTQDDTFDTDFTVRGNLVQTGRYFKPRQPDIDQRIETLLDRFGLREYADAKPDTLSGGYKRRLMIARSVMHQPKVVFLDEPTTGLDPQARVAVWELVRALRDEGLAIVLTTHYMDEAARLSDRLQVLQAGRVRAAGSPAAVLGDVVGEHVVLLNAALDETDGALAWARLRGLRPAQVLGSWHLPLDAEGLAAFVAAFPDLRYEVRPPTLDDLFLALAEEGVP